MIIDLLYNGSKELRSTYLLIFIVITYLFSDIFSLSISSIFGILLSLFLIQELYLYDSTIKNDKNKDLMKKLDYLNTTLKESESFLYLDPDIINLLYSVKDYEQYNSLIYRKVIVTTNYILRLVNDMSNVDENNNMIMKDPVSDLKTAQKLVNIGSNYFHSFIYNLPNDTDYSTKYKNSLFRYRLLLKRIIDTMKIKCREHISNSKTTIYTKFIPNFEGPRSHEGNEDNEGNFNWFTEE